LLILAALAMFLIARRKRGPAGMTSEKVLEESKPAPILEPPPAARVDTGTNGEQRTPTAAEFNPYPGPNDVQN
jgi:hypothetical protein